MSTALVAETSISGSAIKAHDSAAIANLFAKEKEELRKELEEKNDTIDSLKLSIYRLQNEISSLQNEAKTKRTHTKSESASLKADDTLIDAVYGKTRERSFINENGHTSPAKKKGVLKKKKAGKKSTVEAPRPAAVSGTQICINCSKAFSEFEVLAEKFPQMKLKTYVNCKKKFKLADMNGDGTVDNEELSKILESSGLYFTDSQIKDILSSVDNDDNVKLDFMEVLQVLSTLDENPNRRADLPKSLKDNQSKVCAVM